jgi:hypothetical protein
MINRGGYLLVDMAGPGRRDEPESSDGEMGFAAASPRACSSPRRLSLSVSRAERIGDWIIPKNGRHAK